MLTHKKILIVEDDASQRLFFKMALETYNYEIFEAENGKEAYKILSQNTDIRLVLTDIKMPEMDGFELIQKIREEERRYTYILVASAAGEKESILKALDLGANDFLSKPVVPKELQLRLEGASRLLRLESQDEFILSMAKMAEYRSNETGYHLERVKAYTKILADDLAEKKPEICVSGQFAEEIARVSPLHDIGKVAMPDKILHKHAALTVDEFEVMKSHTSLGGELLLELYEKTGADYLKVAYDIAMFHHERYDGNGYPHGLQGKEIPMAARIMAVADVYDAMISVRCYKKRYKHDFVRSEIVGGKGRQFDPVVVDSFLGQQELWLTVATRYDDSKRVA
ncbi:MAG TPA: response regulator [Desulfocapsa sulfexigens]|nr:response regulator [Desulfocapsa sulfexigens]